ncbi:MAG: kynureninase [Bacteroidetes bacterium]|nr:MAG: kynureninase [Bacteroidota bacterium]MBL1143453.1 kynureninase [Bacteroidota bacterium]NOG56257.1 kynureninase [Bacteroidota bacterium]
MDYKNTKEFATEQDNKDPLKKFRNQFEIPRLNDVETVYFTGNSLGLLPTKGREAINQELNDWGKLGVEGHFEAKNPWYSYHEQFKPLLSKVVGAKNHEVTALGGLTGNLHLLMVSFYRPTPKRYKILCEGKAFPSDQYALESQVKFHGYRAEDAIVELNPREGEHHLRKEDILSAIEEHGPEISLIMIGGVNYYTGQVMPMKEITKAGHELGAIVGFDLAHAFGNIELKLHEWGVDFAAWCSYKYLNSGPGSVAGIYVHERHGENENLPRFAGWWGTPSEGRFKMEKGFKPAIGSDGWQLSNAPVLSMAIHKIALEIHLEAGLENLREKQKTLTGYLAFVLNEISNDDSKIKFEIITPKERGSQLSILTHGGGKPLFDLMTKKGVIADWREPNVIRVAPVPLYNSYMDVFRFGSIIKESIKELA